jgi:hypothetical protein
VGLVGKMLLSRSTSGPGANNTVIISYFLVVQVDPMGLGILTSVLLVYY